jgi:hypothetical protein
MCLLPAVFKISGHMKVLLVFPRCPVTFCIFGIYWPQTKGCGAELVRMDKRTESVEKLSARMVERDVQIDLLKEKAENATPEAKFENSKLISVLQLKWDQAAIELQGIAAASGDEWEDLKAGAELICNEVGNILTDAIEKSR